MKRIAVSSGSPFEAMIGFSRAVRVGDRVAVSGTAPIAEDGSVAGRGDAYQQMRRCLQIVEWALGEAGASLGDVQRTRIYLTDPAAWEGVARAHAEVFGEIRPASTFVVVAALLDPAWLVEMEAEAVVDGGS
ncbi:MAG: RidA family protein [Deinococcales bacterium]